ncbi:MAG: DUF5302 domain-containing protein [Mycobacterium sp.]
MAESNSSQEAKTSGSTESPEPEEDTKRKFREALERKTAKSSGGSDHKDSGGKQARVHGPVENRREFRRRSGG